MDAHLTRYQRWLGDRHGLAFDSYDALWQWSVDELEAFWASVWAYFELQSPTPWTRVLQPAADDTKTIQAAE